MPRVCVCMTITSNGAGCCTKLALHGQCTINSPKQVSCPRGGLCIRFIANDILILHIWSNYTRWTQISPGSVHRTSDVGQGPHCQHHVALLLNWVLFRSMFAVGSALSLAGALSSNNHNFINIAQRIPYHALLVVWYNRVQKTSSWNASYTTKTSSWFARNDEVLSTLEIHIDIGWGWGPRWPEQLVAA